MSCSDREVDRSRPISAEDNRKRKKRWEHHWHHTGRDPVKTEYRSQPQHWMINEEAEMILFAPRREHHCWLKYYDSLHVRDVKGVKVAAYMRGTENATV